MESLYSIMINEFALCSHRIKGAGFLDLLSFDFKKKNIANGKFFLMKDGKIITDTLETQNQQKWTGLKNVPLIKDDEVGDPWLMVEQLYEQYENSCPSEHSAFLRPNFRAKNVDELSFEELVTSMPRIQASYALEAYLMFCILSGFMFWKNPNYWFWKSVNHPRLILYKEWFE